MDLSLTKGSEPRFIEAIAFLDEQIRSGVKLGLESTQRLLAAVGNPQDGIPFVHVAGTNGKGSVCSLVASGLTACGHRTGFFSSPHLVNIRERYRIDNQAISELEFAELIEEMRENAGHLFGKEESPSFFEVTTVLALMCFRKRNCDVAVLEVGMGGRLDATNVVDPALTVITRIGLDHIKPLGDTLYAIAGEKAGIIKDGIPCVVSPQEEEALVRIREVAAEKNAELCVGGEDFFPVTFRPDPARLMQENDVEYAQEITSVATHFLGPHQLENTATAWATLRRLQELGFAVDPANAIAGMGRVRWPARIELLPDGVLVDGAHNVGGIQVLAQSLCTYFPGCRWHVAFGALQTKDWRTMIDLILPFAIDMMCVGVKHKRAVAPEDLAAHVKSRQPQMSVETAKGIADVLPELRERGAGLVIGSLYMAGEALASYTNGMPVPIEVQE